MNILIINESDFYLREIEDMFNQYDSKLFSANNTEEAIALLSEININIVILNFKAFSDVGTIKYIENNHKDTKIYLKTNKNISKIIDTIRYSRYEILSGNTKLQDILINE